MHSKYTKGVPKQDGIKSRENRERRRRRRMTMVLLKASMITGEGIGFGAKELQSNWYQFGHRTQASKFCGNFV